MNVGDLDLPETFSLSFWAYLDDNQGDRWNIQRAAPWANYSLMDRYGNWEFNINYWNFGGSWATTPSAQGAWEHIVGTYDGGMLRLYKNGALASSVARTGMTQNDQQMHIGENVDGRLDEVRAEKVTRPANWIAAISTKPVTGPSQSWISPPSTGATIATPAVAACCRLTCRPRDPPSAIAAL